MNYLTIYGLVMLSGVCFYAVINHLNIGLRRPVNLMHLCFAGLCLSAVFAIFGRIFSYQAQTVADFVAALRWNLGCIFLCMMLFHWVIAEFTGLRPRRFLIGMTVLFICMFVWNLLTPYTLQYSHIERLTFLRLPWDELVTMPVGEHNRAFLLASLALLVDFGFAVYALSRNWRLKHERMTLALLVAIVFFLMTVVEGTAARASIIDFVPLGWLGFLAMVTTMSFILSHDTHKRLLDSEQRFRSLLEQSPFSMQVFSPDGHTIQVNPAFVQLWNNKPELKMPQYNILHDEELVANGVMPYITRGFSGTAMDIPPALFKLSDAADKDNCRWLRSYIYPIKNNRGAVRDVILMHEDVTDKKRIEDAVRLIAAGVASAVGEQFFEQLVLNLAEVFGADYAFIALQDKQEWHKLNMLAACARGQITNELNFSLACVPFMKILKEGTCVYPEELQRFFPEECALTNTGVQALIGTPIYTDDHQRGLLVVMHSGRIEYIEQASEILDIFSVRVATELKHQQAERHIRKLAYQDYLTGLANRAQLHDHMSAMLKRVKQFNHDGALLLIDLDHFKTINDALGHDVGDEVLRVVARRISDCCSQDIFLARFGGDEFIALMERTGQVDQDDFKRSIAEQAQTLLSQLARPVYVDERAYTLGASIGIVCFPEDGNTDLDILRHADMALYHAKNKGRGIIQFYIPELESAATKRLQVEVGLRTAIDKNELEIYFQPLLDVNNTTIGAEALLRWHHEELDEILPSLFIPIAEETGLIHSIGAWVLDQACVKLTQWMRASVPFQGYISVNVCPWQFARPDFISEVSTCLQKHNIDPRRLMLELTESALLYDVNETIDKLAALRKLGLRIALDDFGTGYSSLAYLRDLPLDLLKIDKDFVTELTSTIEHPLVGSMITIGKNMELAVLAEGVETEFQHQKLSALGCECFQGFYFCPPLPELDFLDWLNNNKQLPKQTTLKG
ncbi:MAG: EAL domain-containing protein [Gammaproteobacteria bacterium]